MNNKYLYFQIPTLRYKLVNDYAKTIEYFVIIMEPKM